MPSVVPISASIWAEIGTGVRFGSFEGEMPPLSLRKTLPARMICGLAKAATATRSAIPTETASARTRCFPVAIHETVLDPAVERRAYVGSSGPREFQ